MSIPDDFLAHWLEIDSERMERYETMFRWGGASEMFYAPARIDNGQVVADFGCGPGHTAVEFARRVGHSGHVHALDINAEFIARTQANAEAAGFADRITAHLLQDARIPLPDGTLDRITARNTIVYVRDPVATFAEFRRVLKPGGLAHAIESDWPLVLVEPVPIAEWTAVIQAAMGAWRTPQIGRQLYGVARRAGFEQVTVQVLTQPDTDGRLLGMIRTVTGYARESGALDSGRLDAVMETVERAIAESTYLAVSPQFVVTASA
jgi:ubiquinone/menaquinone biosynthesis C-methylase UbiE